jgi:hypothetical protein
MPGPRRTEARIWDGHIEFTVSETTAHRMGGLSRQSSNPHFAEIDFALHLTDGGVLRIFEGGALRGVVGPTRRGTASASRSRWDRPLSRERPCPGNQCGVSRLPPAPRLVALHPRRVDHRRRHGRGAIQVQNEPPAVSVTGIGCHVPCVAPFAATASDPDGDPLTYEWSGCASGQTGAAAICPSTWRGRSRRRSSCATTWARAPRLGAGDGDESTARPRPRGRPRVPSVLHRPFHRHRQRSGRRPPDLLWGGCAAGQSGPAEPAPSRRCPPMPRPWTRRSSLGPRRRSPALRPTIRAAAPRPRWTPRPAEGRALVL